MVGGRELVRDENSHERARACAYLAAGVVELLRARRMRDLVHVEAVPHPGAKTSEGAAAAVSARRKNDEECEPKMKKRKEEEPRTCGRWRRRR